MMFTKGENVVFLGYETDTKLVFKAWHDRT